jgi:hypothetical protein
MSRVASRYKAVVQRQHERERDDAEDDRTRFHISRLAAVKDFKGAR